MNIKINSSYFFEAETFRRKNTTALGPFQGAFCGFLGVTPLIFDFQQVGFLYIFKGTIHGYQAFPTNNA